MKLTETLPESSTPGSLEQLRFSIDFNSDSDASYFDRRVERIEKKLAADFEQRIADSNSKALSEGRGTAHNWEVIPLATVSIRKRGDARRRKRSRK